VEAAVTGYDLDFDDGAFRRVGAAMVFVRFANACRRKSISSRTRVGK
jgi:hypothetical protein